MLEMVRNYMADMLEKTEAMVSFDDDEEQKNRYEVAFLIEYISTKLSKFVDNEFFILAYFQIAVNFFYNLVCSHKNTCFLLFGGAFPPVVS